MKKSGKQDAIRIVVALAILVLLVVGLSLKRKKTYLANEKEEESKKLVTLDLSTIEKMELTNPLGKMVFERRAKDPSGKFTDRWVKYSDEFDSLSDWAIRAPYEALADHSSLNTLIDNIKDLKSERTIDEKGEKPSEYGLDPAMVTLTLFEKGKANPKFVVKVGEQNSAHSSLYLQTSAAKTIFLGSNSLEYIKTRKPNDWRKKEIFGIKDFSKVNRLNVTYNDKVKKTFSLEQANGKWSIKTTDSLPGDKKDIEDFLSQLKTLSATDVVSENGTKDQKKYGFDRPYARFDLTFDGTKEKSIEIGGAIEKDKDLYVRRLDEPMVFTVRNSLKASLTKEAKQLVNRKPFSFDKGAVSSLSIDREAGPTELVKKENKWSLTKPVTDLADEAKVSSLLNEMVELKGDEFLGTTRPGGLGSKSTWKLKSGDAAEELTLYDVKGKESIGQQGKYYYRFPKSKFENLMTQVGDLRDRAIRSTSMTEFSSLTLQKGSIKARFTLTHDDKWSLGTLDGGDADLRAQLRDGTAAAKILELTDGLAFSKFIDPPPSIDEKSPDSLIVEFQPKTGSAFSWVFGKKENDQRYARSVQRNVVGMVPASPIDELEKILTAEKREKAKG